MLLCSIRLDPFALDVPFHHLWLKDSGLVEEGLLCAVMTIISGVDLGSAIERGLSSLQPSARYERRKGVPSQGHTTRHNTGGG